MLTVACAFCSEYCFADSIVRGDRRGLIMLLYPRRQPIASSAATCPRRAADPVAASATPGWGMSTGPAGRAACRLAARHLAGRQADPSHAESLVLALLCARWYCGLKVSIDRLLNPLHLYRFDRQFSITRRAVSRQLQRRLNGELGEMSFAVASAKRLVRATPRAHAAHAVPYGELNSKPLRALARIAREFAPAQRPACWQGRLRSFHDARTSSTGFRSSAAPT